MFKLLLITFISLNIYASELDVLADKCMKNDAKACVDLAYIYEDGNKVDKDALKAAELYEQACNLKDGYACPALGFAYYFGEGVKKDLFFSTENFKKGCEYNDFTGGGCYHLGIAYEKGTGIKQNDDEALKSKLGCKNYNILKDRGF